MSNETQATEPCLEPYILRVGDRVRIVRMVYNQEAVVSYNRRNNAVDRLTPILVASEISEGTQHTIYPLPWMAPMVGSWLSSMDQTIGWSGTVVQTAGGLYEQEHPRPDSCVQVAVMYPDGRERRWWYSRFAVEFIQEREDEMQNPTQRQSASAEAAAPELRPGLYQPSVPDLQPGLVQQEMADTPPALQPGLVTPRAALQELPETPVTINIAIGSKVAVVRRVYGPSQWTGNSAEPISEEDRRNSTVDLHWDSLWVRRNMDRHLGTTGTVVDRDLRNGVRVRFDSGNAWWFSPLSLERVREAAEEASAPAEAAIPELRPGTVQPTVAAPEPAEPARPLTILRRADRPVIRVGDQVLVVRPVYSGRQKRIYLERSSEFTEWSLSEARDGFGPYPMFDDDWSDAWTNAMNNCVGIRGVVVRVFDPEGILVSFDSTDQGPYNMSPHSLRVVRRNIYATPDSDATAAEEVSVPALREGVVRSSRGSQPAEPVSLMTPFINTRIGLIIGGTPASDSYYVLGIAPSPHLLTQEGSLEDVIIGTRGEDKLEYSPYLKRLIRLATGNLPEDASPLISCGPAEFSRSETGLRTLYAGYAYEGPEQDGEERDDDDDDLEGELVPAYWLAVVDLWTDRDGVVSSGASIGLLDERIYAT
jgi:hypothetical protein